MLVLITYSGDSLTLLYSGTGTAVPLVRTTGLTYIGSYTTTSASVSVRLSFLSPTLYNGDEVITHESGCVVRSSWTGTYSGR
jgi:hypothetical protein